MNKSKKLIAIAICLLVVLIVLIAVCATRRERTEVTSDISKKPEISQTEQGPQDTKVSEGEETASGAQFSWLDRDEFVGGIFYRGLYLGDSDEGRMIISALTGTHPYGVFPTVGIPEDVYKDTFTDNPNYAKIYDYVEVVVDQNYDLIGFRNFGNNVENARFMIAEEVIDLGEAKQITCGDGEFVFTVFEDTPIYWGFGHEKYGQATLGDIDEGDSMFVLINLKVAEKRDGVFYTTPLELWIDKDLS